MTTRTDTTGLSIEEQYLRLARRILVYGNDRGDRTGTGTRSLFGAHLRADLADGFPLLTTKRVNFKAVLGELLWMLEGGSNAFDLADKYGVHIWDAWADEWGNLGPIYGVQWRTWDGGDKLIDQLADVIETIKTNPTSRRMVVSAWNPGELKYMALPPCHILFQFYVADGRLSCHMFQRSADLFLGLPFDIASYATLTHMVAQVTGLEPGELIISLGDVHIYRNHMDQVREQLTRDPRPLPCLLLDGDVSDIDGFKPEHFELLRYDPHPFIKAPISV